MAEGAMQAVLTPVGEFFQWSIGNFGKVLETIVSNPILLISTIGVVLVGFVFGLLGRLIRL